MPPKSGEDGFKIPKDGPRGPRARAFPERFPLSFGERYVLRPYPPPSFTRPLLVVRSDPEHLLVVCLREGDGPELRRMKGWIAERVYEWSHVERRILQPRLLLFLAGPKHAAPAPPL